MGKTYSEYILMLSYFSDDLVSQNRRILTTIFRRNVFNVMKSILVLVVPTAFQTFLTEFKLFIATFSAWLLQWQNKAVGYFFLNNIYIAFMLKNRRKTILNQKIYDVRFIVDHNLCHHIHSYQIKIIQKRYDFFWTSIDI